MGHWLLKTEPSAYSFERLEKDKRTRWDGITNPVALKHLRTAAAGDRVVIYHTGSERRAVGIAEIVRPVYDHAAGAGKKKMPVVDVEVRERFGSPVELSALKDDPAFAD